MNICVYGAASNQIPDNYIQAGEALGLSLARRGHNLIFGGGASGMMGAVARGADKGCAHITSIAPSFFDVDGILYPQCDEYIFTDTMRERKQNMEDRSDGFIVTPGGIGTFEEYFEILTLRQLDRMHKPIAILNTEGYYDHMIAMMKQSADLNFINKINFDLFFVSADIDKVLDYIENPGEIKYGIAQLRNLK